MLRLSVSFHFHTPFFSIPVYTLRNFNLDVPEDNGSFLIMKKNNKSHAPFNNVIVNSSDLLTILKYPKMYEVKRYLETDKSNWKRQYCIFSINSGKYVAN